MKTNLNICLILLSILTGCEKSNYSKQDAITTNNTSNIIDGGFLTDDQLPQMSSLFVDGRFNCSATLIGPNVIVTAAHCVKKKADTIFGPVNGVFYKVALTTHPNFAWHGGNHQIPIDTTGSFAAVYDVAIGILEKEVPDVTPATISNKKPSIKSRVFFAGSGHPHPGIRQFGFANLKAVGNHGFNLIDLSTNKNILQIIGPGDSGGPQFIVKNKNSIEIYAVNSTQRSNNNGNFSGATVVNNNNSNSKFINTFVSENNLKVCGINLKCETVSLIKKGVDYKLDVQVDIENAGGQSIRWAYKQRVPPIASSFGGTIAFAQHGEEIDFLNNNYKDKIILMYDGKISLLNKLKNAEKAGALAVVIIHSSDTVEVIDDVSSVISKLPCVMIKNDDGLMLVDSLAAGSKIDLNFIITPLSFKF